jgi:hypothetical protein
MIIYRKNRDKFETKGDPHMGVDLTLHAVEKRRLLNNAPDASQGETVVTPVQSLNVSRFPELYEKITRAGGLYADDLAVRVVASREMLITTALPREFKSRVLNVSKLVEVLQEFAADDDWSARAILAYLKEVPDEEFLVVTQWDF